MAQVDPRSGEILKCDVIMGDSWVKSYLDELEAKFRGLLRKTVGAVGAMV